MQQYATLSAKRRKEEIAAGADIVLVVRTTRELKTLLSRLDCVDKTDTLAQAVGNAVDYLTPGCVNECFYICRERNRIVHEENARDQLNDVGRYRRAIQRVKRDIQDQIDIQEMYKTEHFNHGVNLFHRGKYDQSISALTNYVGEVEVEFHLDEVKNAKEFIAKSKHRKLLLPSADIVFKRLSFRGRAIGGKQSDINVCAAAYTKLSKVVTMKEDKAKDWLAKGVQPSDTVHKMLVTKGLIEGRKKNVLPKKSPVIDHEKIAKEKAEAEAKEKAIADAKAAAEAEEAVAKEAAEAPVEEATPEAEATEEAPAEEEEKKEETEA